VIQVNGIGPSVPEKQVCCGALHAHAGVSQAIVPSRGKTSMPFANENVPVVQTRGCGAMLASYGTCSAR